MIPIILISNFKLMGKNTIGVTFFPFILLKKSYFDSNPNMLETTITHEKIHIRQQIEMLVVIFYLWYFLEWVFKGFNYNAISFEKECYNNETNKNYLKHRKLWNFIKYVKK